MTQDDHWPCPTCSIVTFGAGSMGIMGWMIKSCVLVVHFCRLTSSQNRISTEVRPWLRRRILLIFSSHSPAPPSHCIAFLEQNYFHFAYLVGSIHANLYIRISSKRRLLFSDLGKSMLFQKFTISGSLLKNSSIVYALTFV